MQNSPSPEPSTEETDIMSMVTKPTPDINNDKNYAEENADCEVQKRARMNRTLLEANID